MQHIHTSRVFILSLLLAGGLTAGTASAQNQLLWGDLHLHTNLSTDAFATGNKGVGPNEAYRFAKGIPVYHPNLDTKVKIDRPLDFLAITDHATNLGIDVMALEGRPELMATPRGRDVVEALQAMRDQANGGFMRYQPEDGNRAELAARFSHPPCAPLAGACRWMLPRATTSPASSPLSSPGSGLLLYRARAGH